MRLAYRVSIEIFLVIAGAWAGAWAGGAALILLWVAAATGIVVLWCRGELRLATRCPRLDRLGLRVASHDAPWEALIAADAALRTLERDIGHFREFFPDARRNLINAAARALEAQRVLLRTEAALEHAPAGEGRILLEAQRTTAMQEIAGLTRSLRELRARLIASTQPLSGTTDPAFELRALEERTFALSRELQS
ncbi:MAG: hypothetical protein ACJ78X_19520 [Myxococcales bacterium]